MENLNIEELFHKLVKDEERENLTNALTEIQNDCHKFVECLMEKGKENQSYQDATNLYFFVKLAEYQLKIKQLEQEGQNGK